MSSLPGNFEEDTASFIPSLAPSGSFEQRLLDDTLLDGESSVMFLEPSASGDDVEVLLLSAVSRRRASPHRARDPAFFPPPDDASSRRPEQLFEACDDGLVVEEEEDDFGKDCGASEEEDDDATIVMDASDYASLATANDDSVCIVDESVFFVADGRLKTSWASPILCRL